MICPNCSQEVATGKTFCPNCGTKVGTQDIKSTPSEKARQVTEKRSMSRKAKWSIGLTIFLLLGGAGTYFGMYHFIYHPEKQIETIRKAIVEEDAATLSSYVQLKGGALDEKQTKQFVDGIVDSDLDTVITAYLERVKRSRGASNEDVPVRLVEADRKFGIFPTYVLELLPQTMYVSSNLGGITVSLPSPYGKERLETVGDAVIIHEAFPGNVEVAVSYDGQYGQDEALETFNSLTYTDEEEPFVVTFNGLSVKLDQAYADSTLYVNGEDSGKTIGEWKSYGPVPKQGVKLSTEIDTRWGTISSNEVLAKPEMETVTFTPVVDETTISFAYDIVERHANQWVDFMYYEDLSYLTVVTDSEYLAKQRKTYESLQDSDEEWYGSLEDVTIINQKTKLIEWKGEPAIETEAVIAINSRFASGYLDDTPESLVKSHFRYIIAEEYEEGEYHIVKATYLE